MKPRPHIVKAYRRRYRDNGQHTAYVEWSDGSRTEGPPYNKHMMALFVRARRDGVKVRSETW